MLQLWSKTPIKYKIISVGLLIIVLFSSIVFFYVIPVMKDNIIDRKKEKVHELSQVALSTIKRFYWEFENDRLTEQLAKSNAMLHLWDYRYGPDNESTFWIIEADGTGLVFPFDQSLTGQDLTRVKDPDGRFPFKEMIDVCTKEGHGFLRYNWQYKSFVGQNEPMVAYVEYFREWGWIVGTGVYIVDVNKDINAMYRNLSIIAAITSAVALILLFLVAVDITRPVLSMKDAMKNSDLKTRLEIIHHDELGSLAKYFNMFVEHIADMVHEIRDSSGYLAAASEEMSAISVSFADNAQEQRAASRNVTLTVQEITKEMDKIVSDIEKEFDSLNKLVDRMHALTEIINTLDDNTNRSLAMIDTVSEKALSGQNELNVMGQSIRKIKDSSQEMTEIINMINDISEQINLLSLNASIEAARAGDAGRGFAVVAEEISKLADKTADSTKSINELIAQNDTEIDRGITQMGNTITSMNEIINSVQEIGTIIHGFVDLVKNQVGTSDTVQQEVEGLKEMASDIRMSTKVQRMSITEINDLIENINTGTEEIASNSEELAGNTEEISGMADNLRARIEIFKLDTDEAPTSSDASENENTEENNDNQAKDTNTPH